MVVKIVVNFDDGKTARFILASVKIETSERNIATVTSGEITINHNQYQIIDNVMVVTL